MAVTINLYPPVVDTYMPAFLINSEMTAKNKCRIYFALSLFNTENQIANCQITVRNMNTNLSALNPARYPSEVMIAPLQKDEGKNTNDNYFVDIDPKDIVNENFLIDQYYKVQIRFTSVDAQALPSTIGIPPIDYNPSTGKYSDAQSIDQWLLDNLLQFSEWSTVCLVRGISEPTLEIKDASSGTIQEVVNTVANITLVGKLTFADEDETETMKSYKVCLFDSEGKTKYLDSGNIFTSNFSNPNEINYPIDFSFEVGSYYVTLEYTTQNLYSDKIGYHLDVVQGSTDDLHLDVQGWADEENGRVILKANRTRGFGSYTGQILIRRTDSKSNFKIWEDLYSQHFEAAPYISIKWCDYTIESGVLYKYGVQGIGTDGIRTPMIQFREPIMVLFDHMFLTGDDKQLKIKFNPQVSSFKMVVNENKTDTIGSKYPVIRRNGDVYYSSFSMGGLIAAAMDEEGIFTSKQNIYNENQKYYDAFNESIEVDSYNDFIFEKFFRDKVKEFLYDGKAKLLRSPSEGNILVRLMDINMTPNQTLGRRLWSFSANAHEIDECTIDNYDKYDIFTRISSAIGRTNGDENLIPIQRIVFINSREEFPEEGREYVLYVFEEQFYVWDTTHLQYNVISVPQWHNEDGEPNRSAIMAVQNTLYTNNSEIYQWDEGTETFNEISEPITNQRYYPDENYIPPEENENNEEG